MPTIDNWRALREALQAGPTDGPWVMHRADFALEDGRASTHANVYKKGALHQAICGQKSNRVNGRTEQRMADLGYIAAAHPAAIRSLLDERDRLAAEVEALRADAGRYRWLRSVPSGTEAKSIVNDAPFGMDESIDAAMKGKP